jgi:hypothetical protein
MGSPDDIPRKQITIRMEREKHKRMRLALTRVDKSLQQIFDEWMDRWLEKNDGAAKTVEPKPVSRPAERTRTQALAKEPGAATPDLRGHTVCSQIRFHREGQYCKTCGVTP